MKLILYIPADLERRLQATDSDWKTYARRVSLDALRSATLDEERLTPSPVLSTAAAVVDEQRLVPYERGRARVLAERGEFSGKCTAYAPRGTRCKLCGKAHS